MPHPFRFSCSLSSLPTDQVVDAAKRAENLGYSTVTMADHFTDQPAPLIGLTAAALATTKVRVLPLVLANDYRHPVVLAKEIATIDALSGGRVDFGIGAGWMLTDYEQAGMQYDSAGTRIRRLSESVDVLRALFRGDYVILGDTLDDAAGEVSIDSALDQGTTVRLHLLLAGEP